jgi:hypothetical protein
MTSRNTGQSPAQAQGRASLAQMAAELGPASGPAPVKPLAPKAQPVRAPRRPRSSHGSDQTRLAELKAKLRDEDYMNGAILRIATVLSARLTLR